MKKKSAIFINLSILWQKFEIWFDLDDCTPNGTEYREYLHLSALDLKQIIQEEVDAGIPMNKIIIGKFLYKVLEATPILQFWGQKKIIKYFKGGFAYGGTMALHMGYRYMTDLAGVFLLSSYLQTDSIIYKVNFDLKTTNILFSYLFA